MHGRRDGQMSLRRGFNRVFVILWAVYVIWIIWYPIHEEMKMRQAAFDVTGAIYQSCLQAHDSSRCWTEYEDGLKRDMELYKIGGIWTENGWNLLWLVPVVLFVPPAAAYGVVLGLVKVGAWVVSGFRGPKASSAPQ